MSKDSDKPNNKILPFVKKPKFYKPFSKAEREEHKQTLYKWRDLIDRGKLEEAKKLMQKRPEYVANLGESLLWYLFCLFEARYFRAVGDKKAFDNVMFFLGNVAPEFDDEYSFYYYRLVGFREYDARRYKTALKALNEAEAVGAPDWFDVGYYLNYGRCLSDMGFTEKAAEYFNKAKNKAQESKNYIYDMYIQCFLAYDYIKMGKCVDALECLRACSIMQKIRNSDDASTGFMYLTYGLVYHNMNIYDHAIEYYETAFRYYTEGSAPYARTLYNYASALITIGRVDEGVASINRGFSLLESEAEWSGVWEALYDALKHSALLSIPESLEHMKNNAIPKLLDFGQYEEAANSCEQVSEFYENAGDTVQALEHSKLAIKIYKKYLNDRVKGVTT